MNVKSASRFLLIVLFALVACQSGERTEDEDDSLPTLVPIETQPPANTPTPLLSTLTATAIVSSRTPTATLVAATATQEQQEEPSQTPTAPPSCQMPFGWVVYIVQAGDTLFSLAQRSGTSVAEIQRVNCLVDDRIYAGQSLFLPRQPAPRPTPVLTSEPLPVSTPAPTATSEPVPPPGPGEPSLEISPFSGPIGTQFTVVLEEFSPGETVNIMVAPFPNGAALINDATIVDENGDGIYTFEAGQDFASGLYVVVATGDVSAVDASANFQIMESATATP